ncbi:hypothetical protein KP509_17G074300 [Ceratopteris richardii]|uniref:Uncharacterized protein n=1 Tax=Ceratopteris richardii TaxID=49495 RepID=A0A8T2SVD8_CERRI|nr:hypothetical protein KP509_17G074300 [Ceratopteris richardii]
MGSLKRKSASLGGSAASNKRPSREDTSTRGAISNGYVGRRSGGGQALPPSSSSSSSAAAAASAVDASDVATAEALCNGTSISTETGEDPHPSISAPLVSETKSNSLKDATISESEPGFPVDPQDQEADITIVLSERSHSNKLGPLTPNHAGWFSWTSIHALEQRWLPEFFNSKSKLKTPALYMEYRNLILRKYLENPDKVFTLTDISQVMEQKGGHLEPAKRIFEFLNHWGLLNSRALQHAEAEKPTAKLKSATDNQSAGKSQSSLMSKLYRFESPSAVDPSRASSAYDKVMPNVVMSESAASDAQGGMQGIPVEYHCNTCSADCSKKRFHCQKQADFDLCPDCYNEGKFSFGITSTDFILMEAVTDSSSSDGWSDQETLLLLEALEMFGDNFSEIAEHVASKTKAQCILHFIRLPIEDPFLEALEPIGQPVADSLENVACEGDAQEGNAGGEAIDRVDEEDGISVSENVHLVELVENEERDSSATNAIRAAAEAAGLFASDTYLALSECGNPVMTLVCHWQWCF